MEQPTDQKLTGFKKRQQIEQANKLIFVWVAVAAVIISICFVLLQFLVREGLFNLKIINAKSETNRTLEQNIKNAAILKEKVDALIANENLATVRTATSDNNLKVVLDALPTTGDSTTFANSLQNAILNLSGAKVVGLSAGDSSSASLAPVAGVSAVPGATPALATVQELPFTANLSGNYSQIKTALLNIEQVIRPMNVTTLILKGTDAELTVSINGVTYYLPEKSVKLGSEMIKP